DPAAIYAQVRVPVLIVSGGKDVQCPPGDGSRIADIVPGPSELHLIDDLTHLLRRSDTAAGFRGYAAQFSQPMDPSLAALAVAWLRASFAPHFGHDGGEIAKQR